MMFSWEDLYRVTEGASCADEVSQQYSLERHSDLIQGQCAVLGREVDLLSHKVYPVPQNSPHESAGMNPVRSQPQSRLQSYDVNVLGFPEEPRPKGTDVSQWYGVYN